jgi:hypothetical protein
MEPGRVQAAHQSLHHLVANAEWSDEAVLSAVRQQVLPAMVTAWCNPRLDAWRKGTNTTLASLEAERNGTFESALQCKGNHIEVVGPP